MQQLTRTRPVVLATMLNMVQTFRNGSRATESRRDTELLCGLLLGSGTVVSTRSRLLVTCKLTTTVDSCIMNLTDSSSSDY